MSAQNVRKKFAALVKVLEREPEITVVNQRLGSKERPERVENALRDAGLTIDAETKAYVEALTGLELQWVLGRYDSPDSAWNAWEAEARAGYSKLGARAGTIQFERVTNLVNPRAHLPEHPHLKWLDQFDRVHDLYYPVVLDLNPEAPWQVRMGDDYGASFRTGNPITLGGYLELVVATAGLGREQFLLKHRTAKDRPRLDAASWFDDFDAAATLGLIKGHPDALRRWNDRPGV